MGIPSQLARILLREHKFKPITGTYLSIGRQTIYLTPAQAVAMIDEELGFTVDPASIDLELDERTRGSAGEAAYISDRSFLALFSDAEYRCLDVSDYEGADIVFDLCARSVPDALRDSFDFIFDGSTLDNVFDPASGIRNIANMLNKGGRVLHVDRASRRHNVYVGFSLAWFHDFYAVNAFDDCQVYLAQWDGDQIASRWDFYHYEPMNRQTLSYFGQDRYYFPWRHAHAVVLAEKGSSSTWERSPIQFEYRPSTQQEVVGDQTEIVPVDGRISDDDYVRSCLRFFARGRPLFLFDSEKADLPDDLRHYAPENVYCGSIEPVLRG